MTLSEIREHITSHFNRLIVVASRGAAMEDTPDAWVHKGYVNGYKDIQAAVIAPAFRKFLLSECANRHEEIYAQITSGIAWLKRQAATASTIDTLLPPLSYRGYLKACDGAQATVNAAFTGIGACGRDQPGNPAPGDTPSSGEPIPASTEPSRHAL